MHLQVKKRKGNLSFNSIFGERRRIDCRVLRVTPIPTQSHSLHPTANRSQSDPSSPISHANPLSRQVFHLILVLLIVAIGCLLLLYVYSLLKHVTLPRRHLQSDFGCVCFSPFFGSPSSLFRLPVSSCVTRWCLSLVRSVNPSVCFRAMAKFSP